MAMKAVAGAAASVLVSWALHGCDDDGGGGTMPHPHYDDAVPAPKYDADVEGWTACGLSGGCEYKGEQYSNVQAFEHILKIDNRTEASTTAALTNLGKVGGGTYKGKELSKKECFEAALAIDHQYTAAWAGLEAEGGGKVADKDYSAKECAERLVELQPHSPEAWAKLQLAGGGKVNGETYSAKDCGEESSRLAAKAEQEEKFAVLGKPLAV